MLLLHPDCVQPGSGRAFGSIKRGNSRIKIKWSCRHISRTLSEYDASNANGYSWPDPAAVE